MTTFEFFDSQYRFTNPVRIFKANDPYFVDVDNIPIKQLNENDNWLRDQFLNLRLSTEGGIGRDGFKELQPYVVGADNVVRVKPGRFTARINDAYNLTPLQVISKITGTAADSYNTWEAASLSDETIGSILEGFKTAVALNLNGLVERAFTRPAYVSDSADTRFTSQTSPKIAIITGRDSAYGQPPYGNTDVILWDNFTDSSTGAIDPNSYIIRQYDDTNSNTTIGFARMASAETAFIKRWRGIARTSVVDIPEELSIEIPAFDARDFYYIDSQGGQQFIDAATQRIDLLFVYAKPIDASSTTVAKFVNGSPTTITQPELGIVYGAGIGVNFRETNVRTQTVLEPNGISKNFPGTQDSTLPDGTLKMLASYGDQLGTNTGFNISGNLIKGSFPSPDDLMNLSPLLDEDLGTNSFSLIGQTVLPLAYIVVRKAASLNVDGTPILTGDDIVDIRPFFRTTELSYNERAGIAAAVPAPSIANPIVTQAEMDYELKKLRADILARIPAIPNIQTPTYRTFYTRQEKTVTLPTDVLIKQGLATTNNFGSKNNPTEIVLNASDFVSGSPLLFPSFPNEPEAYRRYLTEVNLRIEAVHFENDIWPACLSIGFLDANANRAVEPRYVKSSVIGLTIADGEVRNGDGYGGYRTVNHVSYSVSGSNTAAPVLPLIMKSYISRDEIIDTGSPLSVTENPYDTLPGDSLYFKVYLTGYKYVTVERFKGIPLDS